MNVSFLVSRAGTRTLCVLVLTGGICGCSESSKGGANADSGSGGRSLDGAAGNHGGSGGLMATGGATTTGGASGAGGTPGTGGTAGAGGSGGMTVPDASMPTRITCGAPTPNATSGNACQNTPPPPLVLTEVMRGFDIPVLVTFAPGDTSRLFVVEKTGQIRVIKDGVLEPEPFLDLSGTVYSLANEQGLLGLAFDPNYQETGRFWVNYSGQTGYGDTHVIEYRGTPGQPADPISARELLEVTQPSALRNHNGGMLAFGPDGCLYIGMGDGGDANDPNGHGQNAGDALGNMLRVDVDAYPTPAPGNMTGTGVDPHSWDYGLRNPWRFSFDRVTGDLYIGDVGQDAWEEVDVEPAGVGHRNYGWNVMEGFHCRVGTTCDATGKTLPAAEQQNTDNNVAVIGGYVYRGSAIPGLVGRYLYSDHQSRRVWSFTWSGESDGVPGICDEYELTDLTPAGNVTSFGEDAAGELYLVTYSGIVYRIDPG